MLQRRGRNVGIALRAKMRIAWWRSPRSARRKQPRTMRPPRSALDNNNYLHHNNVAEKRLRMSQFTAFSSRPTAAAAPPSAPPQTVPIPAPAPASLPEVEQAFADQPELKKRVYSAIGKAIRPHHPQFMQYWRN